MPFFTSVKPMRLAVLFTFLVNTLQFVNAADVEVGYVTNFSGSPADYTLLRQGETVSVSLFTPVNNGDWVHIHNSDTSQVNEVAKRIELYIGGKQLILTHVDTPYLINSSIKQPSLANNLIQWAGNVLSGWQEDRDEVAVVQLTTRSLTKSGYDPIRLPLLVNNSLVTETNRPFFLYWTGGISPYQLKISTQDRVVASRSGIHNNRIKLDDIHLMQGHYTITIIDSAEHTLTGTIQVIPPSSLPALPEDFSHKLSDTTLAREVDDILLALWLTEQGNGEWGLEAYQRISNVAESYPAAHQIREALEGSKGRDKIKQTLEVILYGSHNGAIHRIRNEDKLASGDGLQIRIHSLNNQYVYVFLRNSQGNVTLLNNTQGGGTQGFLLKKSLNLLLPAEDDWFMLDESTGIETVLVVSRSNTPASIDWLQDLITNQTGGQLDRNLQREGFSIDRTRILHIDEN